MPIRIDKLFLLCLGILIFSSAVVRGASSCYLSASAKKGCVPTADTIIVHFSGLGAGVRAISFSWDFGDGTTSSQVDSQQVHIFYRRGQYQPSVTVTFSDGSTCTATLGFKVRIFDNPVPNFSLPVDTIRLCDTSVKYCFKDASRKGLDKAPISHWLWDFRDGSPFDTNTNPCHSFPYSNSYKMTLRVTDTNGCSNLFSRLIPVKILPPGITPKPSFIDSFVIPCNTTQASAFFTNTTDTAGKFITKFKWDFGDGSSDSCTLIKKSCFSKWSKFSHLYKKAGTYCPILYITTKYNCSYDSFKFTPCIEILDYKPHPIAIDSNECFPNNNIHFSVNPDPRKAGGNYWNFGDPKSRDQNYSSNAPITSHNYSQPGIYTVYFSSFFGKCFWDTVFCKRVRVSGPIAKIQLDTSLDRIPLDSPRFIPVSQYAQFFDTCHPPIYYSLRDSQFIPNGDTTFGSYCKAKVEYKHNPDYGYDCNKNKVYDSFIVYKRPVLKVKDQYKITWTNEVWYQGDPYPTSGKVYKGVHFENRPLVWDDTDIFSIHCGPPKLIHFTNFSVKYRGYEASDNFPPGSPDTCRKDYNPVYPWASDSLSYFWNFMEGTPDTSTAAKPNRRSQYSTEKLPWHLSVR